MYRHLRYYPKNREEPFRRAFVPLILLLLFFFLKIVTPGVLWQRKTCCWGRNFRQSEGKPEDVIDEKSSQKVHSHSSFVLLLLKILVCTHEMTQFAEQLLAFLQHIQVYKLYSEPFLAVAR